MLMLQKNELYRASISVFLLMYPRTTWPPFRLLSI